MCNALHNLLPYVQFKKHEKYPLGVLLLLKLQARVFIFIFEHVFIYLYDNISLEIIDIINAIGLHSAIGFLVIKQWNSMRQLGITISLWDISYLDGQSRSRLYPLFGSENSVELRSLNTSSNNSTRWSSRNRQSLT